MLNGYLRLIDILAVIRRDHLMSYFSGRAFIRYLPTTHTLDFSVVNEAYESIMCRSFSEMDS